MKKDIKINKKDKFYFNTESLIIDNKLEKQKPEDLNNNSVRIIEICIPIIRLDLINNIERTVKVYKQYKEDHNIINFLPNDSANLAVDFILDLIIEELLKNNHFFSFPISAIHYLKESNLYIYKEFKQKKNKIKKNKSIYRNKKENINRSARRFL